MKSIYKPRVCIFIDWFLPGYKAGGPVRSIANMIELLGDGIDFSLITTNKDRGEQQPYPDIKPDVWICRENYRIMYLSKPSLLKIREVLIEEKMDVVYFNSFYSIFFTLIPLLLCKLSAIGTKIILAPRGMLQQGALSVKAPKKKVFISAIKYFKIFDRICWHATDGQEKEDIKKIFGAEAQVIVAQNIPQLFCEHTNFILKERSPLKLVTISLITAKKNILAVLKALQQLEQEFEVEYDLYGPVKDQSYWQLCLKEIKSLKANIKVTYKGDLHPSQVNTTLQQYHFFILPSLGENFGHAIYESLNAGRPVIISNLTPWKNLQAQKAGWDIDIEDEQALPSVIKTCYRMDQFTFDELCKGAQGTAEKFIAESDFISRYQQLFTTHAHRI